MKWSCLWIATLCFLTFNGSCALKAAQAAAPPAAGKDAAAQKPVSDPRFEGIDVQHHAYIKTLEKTHKALLLSWFKLRDLYAEAHHCATVFGTRERKRARSKLPSLLSKIDSEKIKFERAYERARAPILKKEMALRDRAMKLSEKQGAKEDPLVDKRLEELYSEAYAQGAQLSTLKALDKAFYRGANMPSELTQLGLPAKASVASKVLKKNPRLVEARFTIKDCEADLATLDALKAAMEQDPKKRWGAAQESMVKRTRQTLDKAVANLKKEAERVKLPFLRDAAKFKKKVDMTQKKIDDLEKRKRKTTTYEQRLSEYTAEMDQYLEAAALIDQLTIWKQPEKKAPAKKGAKKGGH
ncbi:MAG: hypothetical protein HN919_06480 [Verrucomicrobia bacterium]|jgi:hypothetical protein|nr:hypothetical protein [Verrucomicrobiota bacterium]MBT7065928.1 hypothetical protein [Verrucomicrobiota bacterium]MBT7699446.1 hypothetical protein [Verrucomicrobiota bacterium]